MGYIVGIIFAVIGFVNVTFLGKSADTMTLFALLAFIWQELNILAIHARDAFKAYNEKVVAEKALTALMSMAKGNENGN